MKKYLPVNGFSITGSSLSRIKRAAEINAIGSAPGWALLFDPDPKYMTLPGSRYDNAALNRENGKMLSTERNVINDENTGPEFIEINGSPAIRVTGGSFYQFYSNADISPDEWTVFAVVAPSEEEGEPFRQFIAISDSSDTEGLSLSIGFSNGDVHVYEYGNSGLSSPTRLSAPDAIEMDGTPHLVMATFSTRDGLRIFVDGQLKAQADDKRPLERMYQAGEYRIARFLRGGIGMSGVLNADLGQNENTKSRQRIETLMMSKYGISA